MLPITEEEYSLNLDFRLPSTRPAPSDLVFYVFDQYETTLPFFAIPLGGSPRYQYDVKVELYQ